MSRPSDLTGLLRLFFRDEWRKDLTPDPEGEGFPDDEEDLKPKLTSYIDAFEALKHMFEFITVIFDQFLHILNHVKFRRLINPSSEKQMITQNAHYVLPSVLRLVQLRRTMFDSV